MVLLACPCLNVKVQTQADRGEANPSSCPPGYSAVCCSVTLGVAGVHVEHATLVRLRCVADPQRSPATWLVLHCANCDTSAVAVLHANEGDAAAVTAGKFPGTAAPVLVSTALLTGAEVDNVRSRPSYSTVFRISLNEELAAAHSSGPSVFSPELDSLLVQLQDTLKAHFESETRKMEDRIRRYEEEQRAELERQQTTAMHERTALWASACALYRQEHATGTSSSSSPPSTKATASSEDPVIVSDPGASLEDALSDALREPIDRTTMPAERLDKPVRPVIDPAPTKAAADTPSKAALAGSPAPFGEFPNSFGITTAPSLQAGDLDAATGAAPPAIFSLEGFEEEEESSKYDLGPEYDDSVDADASPVRSPMETRAPPPSFAEPVLFASSLPISIPLATYQPTTTLDGLEQRRLDGVEQKHTLSASLHEDLDDETQFVAPHVLSARTYQEGAIFGDLPSRRHRRAGGL